MWNPSVQHDFWLNFLASDGNAQDIGFSTPSFDESTTPCSRASQHLAISAVNDICLAVHEPSTGISVLETAALDKEMPPSPLQDHDDDPKVSLRTPRRRLRRSRTPEAPDHSCKRLRAAVSTINIFDIAPPSHLRTAFDRYLFDHYWNTLTMALYPIALEGNPFRTVYTAISQEFPPLTNAILCASASHLTGLGRLPHNAVEPYRKNLRSSFRRSKSFPDHEIGMAATVLFTVSSGVSKALVSHLTAAD